MILWLVFIITVAYSLHNYKNMTRKIAIIIPLTAFLFVLISIPLSPISRPNGFIIQDKYASLSVLHYKDGKDQTIEFPSKTTSIVELQGKSLLCVDGKLSMNQPTSEDLVKTADYIIIGKGAEIAFDELEGKIKQTCNIVLHTGIGIRKESRLLKELQAQGFSYEKIYSLRQEGPLHDFR